MHKVLNIIFIITIILFIFNIFQYYSSNKNIIIKSFNRNNIEDILKNKTSDLPVLVNDTNNVIEFNNSIENNLNDEKKRSFWDLLKRKNAK